MQRIPPGLTISIEREVSRPFCWPDWPVLRDRQIIDAVSPYVQGECLVAIDAPLIVANASGQRPAERALNADFGGFDAGAHSANMGIPVFSSGPRAARIADALGLNMDPY